MKQISSNQNFDITESFSARQLLKLSFMSAKDRANLYIFTVAFLIVRQMKQCIVLRVLCFYLRRSKGPLVFLSTRDKRIAIILHEIQRLNIGKQYKKDAT